ncbi:NCS2 family permease [soil metagenome]
MADTSTPTPATKRAPESLERVFRISERGSSLTREVRGGVVTFFTMAYIVVLNPLIIGTVPDGTGTFLGGGSSPDLAKVAAATALVAGVMSILMGVVANYPLALATGLGLNAFVAFGIAVLPGVTWADAMGLVVLEGLIILVLVVSGLREAVFNAVPMALKAAISAGIGLFIALIGFVDAGFVRGNAPAPPLALGIGGELDGWPVTVFVVGLLIVFVLMARKVRGAILIGIGIATALAVVLESALQLGPQFGPDGPLSPTGWSLNVPALPDGVIQVPDLGLLGQFSLLGSFSSVGGVTVVLLLFTLLLTDFFDTLGTMVAIGAEADLLDEQGNPPGTTRILIIDSLGAAAGGAAGVSSNTAYIESATGVADGARTGLAAVVTGMLFLLTMFLAPLVALVPYEAAAPALVVVGVLMLGSVAQIDFDDLAIAIPAFLTIVLMPFTYSIAVGIGAGLVTHALLMAVTGRARQVHALLWVVAGLFVLFFAVAPISRLLGIE